MLLEEFNADCSGFLLYSITAKPTTDSHCDASAAVSDDCGAEKVIDVVSRSNKDSMEDLGASMV
jgi:hypothetical protein